MRSLRPQTFSVGQMRHRITIQQPTETVDSYGQPIVTWGTFLAGEPAQFMQTGGGESIRNRQVEANVKAIFTVRYRAGYTEKMRIYHDGDYYGILRINPVEGGKRYLELFCGATP